MKSKEHSRTNFLIFSLCFSLFYLSDSPHGPTVTWWGCCGWRFWRKPTELARPFLVCSCFAFCLYGPYNYIPFQKFLRVAWWDSVCVCVCVCALYFSLNVMTVFWWETDCTHACVPSCVCVGVSECDLHVVCMCGVGVRGCVWRGCWCWYLGPYVQRSEFNTS